MTNQPIKTELSGARWVMTFDNLTRVDQEFNRADFFGPDREANARLFVHASELVEAAKALLKNIEASAKEAFDANDGSWPAGWKENAPDEYKVFVAVRAILAKIKGDA